MLHGLSCEWEKARWLLSPSHRERMCVPLFSLRDVKKRWGYWSGEKREISLSRALVLDHSWDAVREVLLHEMAHQMAEEVLGAHHEPPHGPQFQLACHLLRADPKASGNYRPLDERIFRETSPASDKMLLRVKKLLALAESPDRHEADAAMAKAHELIAKYNIDQWKREEDRDLASVFLGQPALRHFPEDYSLTNLLLAFYFVGGIWVSAYVPTKGKMGRVLEISGTLPNIKLAHYVYDFVRQFIRSQWTTYNHDKGLNRHRQTDFALGIIEGFRLKLESTRAERKKNSNPFTLLKMEDPFLKKYFSYRYPHTAKVRAGNSLRDIKVIKDGRNVGKNLVVFKAIVDQGKTRGFMIGS
ncbi:MAG: DUF2786 domain-containing protein [Deltaproteobacteria bacterium]|nr:DUF2786 domain-containing protein [Deltaproteobacteria bacterium]